MYNYVGVSPRLAVEASTIVKIRVPLKLGMMGNVLLPRKTGFLVLRVLGLRV